MTNTQKNLVDDAFRRLKELPGSDEIDLFSSLTGIVRIQDRANQAAEKHTRMFCILETDDQNDIENKVMDAFFSIREAVAHETTV